MKFLGSLLSALWVVCSALSLHGADSDHAKSDDAAIQSATQCEAGYTDALLHRKIDELTTLFVDAYTNTSSSGELRNKAQYLEALRNDTSQISEIYESERQIHLYGETAIVTVRFEVKGTDQGASFEIKGRATDIWILRDGKWLCVAAHSSSIK